jgi:hypothetical protein
VYREVLPLKDHLAMICSIDRTSTIEIDGQVVVRTPSSENVEVCTDTHNTHTRAERSGISRLELERDVLERGRS